MPKKSSAGVSQEKQDKSFANVLQATGLSQLKPIKPTRKEPALAKPKPKPKSKK